MPTVDQFELAASLFDEAAAQIRDLTVAAEAADPGAILRGGSLGTQVPQRIAAAGTTARWCHDRLGFMARTCRERALVVADYVAALEQFDVAYRNYVTELDWWYEDYYLPWWDDPINVPYPAVPEPAPPEPPSKSYDWIEV